MCKLSNNVYALSFAPHLVSKHGIYAKKMDLPRIKIVKNCNVSSRNLNYIYGFVLRLYDELTKVYAVSKLSKIACKILGIRDINIVGAERIIVPLFHDIVIAAKDFDLKPIEYIVALRELYREKELWIIQKGSYLVKAGLDVEEIEITPYKIDIQIFPVIFSKRVQAIEHVDNIVKNFWGFELRPYQKRAILHILQPYIEHLGYKDPLTIVILPTGSGKSVIFQSSSLALNSVIGGTTIVFSPLLALIEDQIYGLKRRGIDVCRIDSTVSRKDKLECIKRGLKGEVPLIYMTPEQLRNPEVLRLLFEGEINYIVFDEAHCITKWGKTFRPAYLYAVKTIRELREKGLWLPIAMFTATLPKIELNNILRELGVKNALILELDIKSFNLMEKLPDRPRILKGPVLRSNIEIFGFTIKEPSKRPSLLARTVKDLIVWSDKYSQDKPWIGLVFTSFVKSSREYENAEYLAKYLSKFLGEKVAVFHGQLSKGTKEKIINEIYKTSRGLQREPRIIVATKAFGLGVDIPNIRWIVHYLISESVEDYYQEIGRAGRDGDISKAVLLYIDEYDYSRRIQLIKSQLLKPSIVLSTWNLLKDLHTLVRSKTIIVPATLLRSRLFKIIHKLYGRNRSDLAITELCETLGEKALHVLSLAKTIDYEVVSGWASLCNDGYPVGRDPITNEIVRLCIGTRGETVKLDPLNLTVRYSGITIGGYDKYFIVTVYNNRLPWTRIIDEVSRYAFEEFFRLSTAINLAKIIVKGNTYEIRNFIKRYLELGITGLSIMHTRTLLEKIMKNAINEKTILQYYEMPNGNIKITIKLPHGIKYMGREKAKEIRARALAYGIMTAILRTRTPPDLTVAIVPYGYVMKTRESLKR